MTGVERLVLLILRIIVGPNGFSLKPALLRTTAHLRSNDKETDSYALWAWQVRVLQKAQLEQLPVKYVKGTVDANWMKKLAQLSWLLLLFFLIDTLIYHFLMKLCISITITTTA